MENLNLSSQLANGGLINEKKPPANPGNWKCQVLAPTIASESSPPAPRTSPHQELPAAHRMQGKTRPLPQGVEMWTWPVFVLHIYIYGIIWDLNFKI